MSDRSHPFPLLPSASRIDAMHFTIIGAGAVGAWLGIHLEADGHAVTYVVRPGRALPPQFRIVHAGSGKERAQSPVARAIGDGPAPADWVLACVRGDQIDGVMAQIDAVAPSGVPVAIAAAVTRPQLERLRALHPQRLLVTFTPMFNAWPIGEGAWRWLHSPMKNLVSTEEDANAEPSARAFVAALAHARVPSKFVPSAYRATLPLFSSGLALLAAWELCGWGARILAGQPALRSLTARAMREASRVVRTDARGVVAAVLQRVPSVVLSFVLALLPLFAPRNVLEMWSHHGPKI